MDSDGHPLIVSGLNSEPKHAEHVIDYIRAVQRYANDNRISLRIAIHTGNHNVLINKQEDNDSVFLEGRKLLFIL